MSRLYDRKFIESIQIKNMSFSDLEGIYQIQNLSLDVKPQTIYLLRGEVSICTEFLKILAAVKEPNSGEIYVNGESVRDMSFDEFLPYRLNVGLSFSIGGLLSNKTLRENMILPFLYHEVDVGSAEQTVNHLVSWLGIEKFQNQRPASVPGYARKLTTIARAMATEPQILLLDDPVSSLNAATVQKIKSWMKEGLQSKKIANIFIASEDPAAVEGLDHEVIELVDRHTAGLLRRAEVA